MLDTAHPPRPTRRVSWLVALLACVLTLAALTPGGARAASLTVTGATSGPAVPSGFLGISTQYKALEAYTGSDPDSIDTAFVNLLSGIAPGQAPVLRIGGESADWSWIPVAGQHRPPGVNYTITRNWLKVAQATAERLHARMIMDLNLEADNRAVAVGEARAMESAIGRRYIEALEIGNEPELYHHFAWYHADDGAPIYGRPATWSLPEYRGEFSSFAHAMPSGIPIAGPASGIGIWLEQLNTFLRDEPTVRLTTMHAYPLKHCRASHVVTIPQVLAAAASRGFVNTVSPYIRISHAHGKPIRIDELNAISCGGTARVSNSFATSLWMLNTLFGLAQAGANGINVNTVPGSINAVLDPITAHHRAAIAVQPEWYGMLMFAEAAPPGSHIVKLAGATPPTLHAWATRDGTGTVRVVLINQSAHADESTTVRVPAATGPATVESLHAHGLASTSGVSLGGQSFGSSTESGQLTGDAQRTLVTPFAGAYTISVPAASAEMVTFTPPPATVLTSALRSHALLGTLMASW